jgi:perosamine synthetase
MDVVVQELPFIPVAAPSITEREGELAREAALTAWGPGHYAFNAKFESMMASFIGVAHAASLPHATSGLHLALAAANIGAGDEVIGPDVTWIASMAPVSYVGATPIAVDLYGSMCDWPRLRAIANRHDLVLIEDAAESLGSTYDGKQAGSFGDMAVFSFHGSKTITTGEGGMIVTNDDKLFARIQKLRDHGRPTCDRFFQNDEIGFKYKMSSVQAALGIAQMERIDALIDYKRKVFGWYQDRLGSTSGLAMNVEPPLVRNSYWMVTAIADARFGHDKFSLQAALREQGIDSRPFFSRLSTLVAYKEHQESFRFLPRDFSGQLAATNGLNLPSGYGLDEETVDRVCATFLSVLAKPVDVRDAVTKQNYPRMNLQG